MNLFFRISLAVYSFFLTIISVITISFIARPEIYDTISNYIEKNVLVAGNPARAAFIIIALLLLVLSLMFLLSGFRTDKDRKAVSKYTNIGEIKISLNSIESIALAATKRVHGVRETKAYVEKSDDSVIVIVKAIVLSDINIPTLSEDIQVKVKGLIEESTGIKVSNVRVLVENVYSGYKSRVE